MSPFMANLIWTDALLSSCDDHCTNKSGLFLANHTGVLR